jgi:hypothetical protein
MNAPAGVSFDPETVVVLRTVLDEAWRTLLTDQQARITKSDLAVCVLKLAAQGESDPIRLRRRAVESVVGPTPLVSRCKNVRAFDPKLVEAMQTAFYQACKSLGLGEEDDAFTQIVAEKVIELASGGECNPDRLCAEVLGAFSTAGPAREPMAATVSKHDAFDTLSPLTPLAAFR